MSTVMAREIAEQPEAVRRTLEALLPVREEVRSLFASRRRVLFIARGSSSNATLYGRYLLEARAGVNAALAAPSIATHYRADLDLSDTLVVAVSQSGATTEIVEAVEWARSHGAAIAAVTNVADSPLAKGAGLPFVTAAGPEVAVPATKTYLTQLVAMAVLGDALGADVAEPLSRVADEVARSIAAPDGLDTAIDLLRAADHAVVSGRGLCLGTALETALKIEETCLVPVRGYSYADLRHGPISVIEPDVTAVLVAAQDGPMAEPMVELAGDLRRRGAQVVGIGGPAPFGQACDVHVPGPDLPESVAPLGLIPPAQLLVERLARALGRDPDTPRGLAKVTRTDTD
ncbi:MAG TPA: SIS domain-containing protein [Candidatus Janibacter merdipullorum]|nr:SIS domain-containing protein [Candidatus Janibacter merdipullorum]